MIYRWIACEYMIIWSMICVLIFVLVVVAPALHKAIICIGLDTFRLEFRTTCESAKPHHRWVHWATSPFAKASNSRWFRLPKGSKGHLMWLRPCETPILQRILSSRMLPFKDSKCKHGQSATTTCKQMQNMRKSCAILGLCLKEALTRDLWWGMLKIDGSKGATLVSPWNVAMAHISSHQVLSLPKIR